MNNILVPVDFSDLSRNSITYAAQLASVFKAKLLLLHAYMLPTPVSEVPYVMVTVDELQKENEVMIRREAQSLHNQFGIEVESLVNIGIPSDEIKAVSKERNIDLIVMGMKGAGGIDKIIGSTTTNTVKKVKTPVLVVPHDAAYVPAKRIVYASDFSYQTNALLFQPLLELMQAQGASLEIIHIRKDNSNTAEETVGRKNLETYFSNTQHSFVISADTSVKNGITNYLDQHQADLLVMVAHKHGFFDNLFGKHHTTAMAYDTRIPMLVLQDKD